MPSNVTPTASHTPQVDSDDSVILSTSLSNAAISSMVKPPPMPAKIKVIEKPQMLEINPGIWDGLTPEQAKKYYPEDWDRFTKDPYSYRVPRAESYHDLSGKDAISTLCRS